MVLENATASTATDSFEENAPVSDDDPYSTSGGSTNGSQPYHIDTTNFPKPIPVIGSMIGFNETLFSKVLTIKIANGSQLLHRPMSQEEVDAFGYWTAKQISIYSYGGPIGALGGAYRCYTTADTFRFPFYRPNMEKFQPNVFPPRTGGLSGGRAVMAWHLLRAAAYGGVGVFIGQVLFGSYSMSVAAVGELSDKRLKNFVDATRSRARQRMGQMDSAPNTPRQPMKWPQSDSSQASPEKDDASPAGGLLGGEKASESWGNTEEMQSTGQQRQSPQARYTPPPVQPEQSSDQPFGMFDDASPTGGRGVLEDVRAEPQAQARGGSAWDRLRKGAPTRTTPNRPGPNQGTQQPSSQNPWSREQKEGSTVGDAYSFSNTEEERSLAKQEAQKEFDARVEQERRGGDFSKGSGDQKRW